MQPSLRVVFALAVILVLPMALGAQEMILEVPTGVTVLAPCQVVHNKANCDYVHIDFVTSMSSGVSLGVNGRTYVVERMGPGYYLESGVVLEPMGNGVPGLAGQRWLEVYPTAGRVHTSHAWQDLDGNQALSPLDTLAFDSGRALKVKDVRLLVRVKPVPEQP
ncbi:MAG TPA: hypothetical protein VGG03_21720 [Thermoanaerobaculia bacterium]|jgi:hypothetical protein